jgi:hypothetical protein
MSEFDALETARRRMTRMTRYRHGRPLCQTINFPNVSNIAQQLWTQEIMLVPSPPPVTESFALPPDLKVECND